MNITKQFDLILDKCLNVLEESRYRLQVTTSVYRAVQRGLRTVFDSRNDLVISGLENIPSEGGVVFASNHQSWLDIFVLIAACPRRVHFLAKEEFREWPVVRQGIRLSESFFIKSGGDEGALATAVERLVEGRSIGIYPEGAVPGMKDILRRQRDPQTGLLSGRTGAVRLALRAGVPIVPLGVSGTERALPPEVWPKRELIRLPAATPITVKFGEPIYYEPLDDRESDRQSMHQLLRNLTDELMLKIGALVDHRANYAPVYVPRPRAAVPTKLGVLLLHGFSSHVDTMSGVLPHLEKAGIQCAVPVLRGHCSRYEELNGVTARDWYVDAERALIDLWDVVDKVVVVGYSMGGLIALDLATRHPGKIAGIVSVASCLKFADPLARFAGRFSAAIKYWPSPNAFADPALAAKSKGYDKFPLATFASLYDYSREILPKLGQVHLPIRILQSKADKTVPPYAANLIYEKVSSRRREIIWYQKSGHSLLLDVEAEKVVADIVEFVLSLRYEPARPLVRRRQLRRAAQGNGRDRPRRRRLHRTSIFRRFAIGRSYRPAVCEPEEVRGREPDR